MVEVVSSVSVVSNDRSVNEIAPRELGDTERGDERVRPDLITKKI